MNHPEHEPRKSALERLSEVIPTEFAVLALVWFACELHDLANHREAQASAQQLLAVHPCAIDAFREATLDLRDLADRYDCTLADASEDGWPL